MPKTYAVDNKYYLDYTRTEIQNHPCMVMSSLMFCANISIKDTVDEHEKLSNRSSGWPVL